MALKGFVLGRALKRKTCSTFSMNWPHAVKGLETEVLRPLFEHLYCEHCTCAKPAEHLT